MLQLKRSAEFSYSGTNLFLDLIRGDSPPSVVIKSYTDIMINQRSDSRVPFRLVKPIITSYVGFGVCVIFGLLFAVLMPLIGLTFCCCRCCGRCGGRVHQMDAKKDPCRRVVFTICAVVIVTAQLVAIVLAFINHFLLHEALVNQDPRLGAITKLNNSLADTEKALDEMFKLAVNTSTGNLDVQKTRFLLIMDGDLKEFQKEFIRQSKAVSVLTPITEFQTTIRAFEASTHDVVFLKQFYTDLSQLIQDIPRIRQYLMDTLDTNCPWGHHVECTRLLHLTQSSLKTRYTMEQFQSQEVQTLLEQIQRHANEVENLNEFNKTLNNLANVIKTSIQDDLDRAWNDLALNPETRERLAQSFKEYLQQTYKVLREMRKRLTMDDDQNAQISLMRFVEFRFYGGIALLCIPVLIFLLIYLGLCFGTCGHRPYEEAGVCNRGVGANLLLAGVGFVFLFSTVLMLVCTVLFVLGGPIQTEACRYLTGHVPDGPRKLDDYIHSTVQYMIDQIRRDQRLAEQEQQLRREQFGESVVTSSVMDPNLELVLNISRVRLLDTILTRCANESFVDSISGGHLFWSVLYEPIQSILQELINAYKDADLTSPLEQTVQLCMSALDRTNFMDSLNFTKAISQADLPVTQIDDMEHFISSLRQLESNMLTPYIEELEQKVLQLDKARNQARHLYTKLDSIPGLRQQLRLHLDVFSRNLAPSLRATIDVSLKNVRPSLEHELQLAVIATWRDIPCQSLRYAVRGGVDAVCVMVLMPMNAFWAALGLTLILFIPLIIFAVKLAGLYRKTEKYSSDYEEPDYISYHGFYMRPSNEVPGMTQKPRNKMRKYKAKPVKKNSHPRNSSNNRGNSNSRYHQVSVYPYDAYE